MKCEYCDYREELRNKNIEVFRKLIEELPDREDIKSTLNTLLNNPDDYNALYEATSEDRYECICGKGNREKYKGKITITYPDKEEGE